MSIDYNECEKCGEMFTNDNRGEAVCCPECGIWYCDIDCALSDGFVEDENDSDNSRCKYCITDEVKITEDDLFEYALKLLKVTKSKLTDMYKEKKDGFNATS